MARKMRKFADGGNARYDRKVKDIESDYQKALKMGKEAGVAKAKYEQRMADAKDDLAKWTKADRTQTRAAEQAAERNLSEARRTKGESVRGSDAFGAKLADKAPELRGNTGKVEAVKTSSEDPSSLTFAQKFRMERDRQGAGKTFTWRGKSYSTNMAGEGASKPKATQSAGRSGTGPTGSNKPPVAGGNKPPVAGGNKPPVAGGNKPTAVKPTGSPWDKDEKGNWRDPNARGTRMGDVMTLGLTAAARNSSAPTSGPYAALAAKYKKEDADRIAAEKRASADQEARRKAAVESGEKSGYIKLAGMKKGGKAKAKPVKKYAKGGSVDGCAIRGKTRAPMRRK